MATQDIEIDLSKSKLILEGSPEAQSAVSSLIDDKIDYLKEDKTNRSDVYTVRRDFYVGNHSKYTNIVNLRQKEKEGHANAVLNYAGKTAIKISQTMANNPPNITFPVDDMYKPHDVAYSTEETRTQAVEDFCNYVVNRRNHFPLKAYRRGVFNQSVVGDYALKVYPCNIGTKENPIWDIKIIAQEKMENLMVGWRFDDVKEFDFVISEEDRSIQSVKEEFGIEIPLALASTKVDNGTVTSSSSHNANQWGTRVVGGRTRSLLPTSRNAIPTVKVVEYDDLDIYAVKVAGKLVQLVYKDGKSYPRIRFWIIGDNVPVPGSSWSMSDIDFLIDPNIELNEASNEERDYIRVGANQKYVAYNMNDFDPESIKTGSGGVIMIESVDGSSKFEPLPTNVNTYPADTYLSRMKKHIHDLGVPEVTFGSVASSSGRSKAIDYQSMVDLVTFKQQSWQLVLEQLYEKIQILGFFYFKDDYFKDAKTEKFKVRYLEFDWSDIVPITASDKIVNVVNKVQMGLPFRLAYKELGYKDVDAVLSEMRKEAQDPDLMLFRSKMFQLTPGVRQAQSEANEDLMAEQGLETSTATPNPNGVATSPTLVSSQNTEGAKPVSQRGGTTSYSSGKGLIDRTRQNLQAQGQ